MGIETLVVNAPEGVRHVLTTNAANYRRPYSVTRVARPLTGSGLFLAEDADSAASAVRWCRRSRPPALACCCRIFATRVFTCCVRLKARGWPIFRKPFRKRLWRPSCAPFLNAGERRPRDIEPYGARLYRRTGRPTLIDGFARSENTFAFANGRRARFQKQWSAAIDKIISQRKASPTKADHRDLLDLLLGTQGRRNRRSAVGRRIRDQCATMFSAGSETTARLMFWASYLLAMDPEEQANVREEVAAFPPERISGLDDLQAWQRLRCLLLEALRLNPRFPKLYVSPTEPTTLAANNRRRHAGVDQPLGHASPSKILGSADRISSRSIRRKDRPVDADAGLYSLRRGTAHLHRRFVCIVGSPDLCPSAVAFTLQD